MADEKNNKKLNTGLVQDQNALNPGWRSGPHGKNKQTFNFIGAQLYKSDAKLKTPNNQNAYNQPNIENDNLMQEDLNAYEKPVIENDNLMDEDLITYLGLDYYEEYDD